MIRCISQLAPSATTQTLLVSGIDLVDTDINSIIVCNRGTATTFRINIQLLNDTLATKQYLVYDCPIIANDTICLTYPIGLVKGDRMYVYAGSANLTFSVYAR